VVRLNKPADDTAKVRGDYDKERWCIDLAATAGVPGPDVLAIGEHAGRAFMLQHRVPGVNGKLSTMPPGELFQTLGRYARLIHGLPVNGFGDSIERFENGNGRDGWLGFVDYNLGELTDQDPLLALGVYSRDQQATVRAAFRRLRGLPLRVGLNHGDLARRNTIVDASGRVTLLDWGCAEMHIVPHYDLNALLAWYELDHANLRAFLDGYEITGAEWAATLPELAAFALLKSFDLTRWAIDRCPTRTLEIAERAARCLARYRDGMAGR
jgi:aminoglycoside phosphotransferase (APT) family kinase protein